MLQYKMYPAGELAVLRQLLFIDSPSYLTSLQQPSHYKLVLFVPKGSYCRKVRQHLFWSAGLNGLRCLNTSGDDVIIRPFVK